MPLLLWHRFLESTSSNPVFLVTLPQLLPHPALALVFTHNPIQSSHDKLSLQPRLISELLRHLARLQGCNVLRYDVSPSLRAWGPALSSPASACKGEVD